MADQPSLRCIIVTPERLLLDERTDFVAVPIYDGEMGILKGRAPCVCLLGHGALRLRAGDRTERYYVAGGFLQVLQDTVTVLTDTAIPVAQLNAETIERERAATALMSASDDEAAERKSEAVARVYAQKRLLDREQG
jgi:F-type H+-transporting ATPase subunit epsilon